MANCLYTGDNHGSNDKICRLLARHFQHWGAQQHRIRCMGHILNLACHAFHFTRDKDAVELAIKAAEELQQEEEWLGLHSEGEYD